MNKTHVLIISYSYPPYNAPAALRPYALAKYLNKSKFKVTVITCGNPETILGFDPEFDNSLNDVTLIKIDSFYGLNSFNLKVATHRNYFDKVKYKIKKIAIKIINKTVIPDTSIYWYSAVVSFFKRNINFLRDVDYVFSTSPIFTNHLIGHHIKRKHPNIKWLADFRDYHYIENWQKRIHFKSLFHRKFEQKIIRCTDQLCFITPSMQEVYAQNYPTCASKMNAVYNGFDKEELENLSVKTLNSEKIKIFYAGTFYNGARSPFDLFSLIDEAIKHKLISTNDLEINIAGNFDEKLVDKSKSFLCYSTIKTLGTLPRKIVLKKLSESHLLWIIVANRVSHYTGVPIKFYEYLAVRRPIINFAPENSELTKIINEMDLGVNFNNVEFNLSKEKIKFFKLINDFKEGRLNAPLKENFPDKFSRECQTILFENIFSK